MDVLVIISTSLLLKLALELTVVKAEPVVVILHLLPGMFKNDEVLHLIGITLEGFNVTERKSFFSKPLCLSKLRLHNPVALGRFSLLALEFLGLVQALEEVPFLTGVIFREDGFPMTL